MIKDEEGFLSDNTVKAHKMAIKALEQELTKNDLVDCISRAEAIKCLECDFDITGKENMKTVVNYINSAHDKIMNLPRVKQDPRWISVSERLPEPYMFVNATCRSLVDDRENWVVETIYLPIPKEYNPRHYSDWGNIPMLNWGEAEVIAWMERIIPEPYKMVEEKGETE